MIRESDRELVKSLCVNQALKRLAELENAQGLDKPRISVTAREVWAGLGYHAALAWVTLEEIEAILKVDFATRYVSGVVHFFLR